jgi:DNA-binding LacI/PurR family transcriptional regulator
LLELGHRRIGCITGGLDAAYFAERLAGYQQALQGAGLALDPSLAVQGSMRRDRGYQAIHQLLSMNEPPTAIFASIDMLAINVLHESAKIGINVPGELSVVGFDDIRLASMTAPPLTTVAQPKQEIGTLATEMLLERIRDPDMPARERVLDAELVIRGSTAPLSTEPTRGQDR